MSHAATDSEPPAAPPHDPYAALRIRDYRLFLFGNIMAVIGMQMQAVAIGYEIYERTGSAMALGWVGFVQVLPVLLLAMPAGHTADRFPRKYIIIGCVVSLGVISGLLTLLSATSGPLWAVYACLAGIGVARAFQQPAKASLVPLLVPRERFTNAVAWSTGGFHLASIVGPALGGAVIAFTRNPALVYLLDALMAGVFLAMLLQIKSPLQIKAATAITLESLAAGLKFVYRVKIILGSISLDMFAVLLGGATSLMPIYAKDILKVGPAGLGWMQAAPAVGALLMSFAIAHLPPMRRAGRTLLLAVIGFGAATIVFGLSRSFPLSLAALFAIGALDNISVVIRHTLVQLLTPDEMRGRVSAVNSMFIGASNELGGFESGLLAHLTSPTVSVVSGGIGTIFVVAGVALLWPELRRYGRLGSPAGETEPAPSASSEPALEASLEAAPLATDGAAPTARERRNKPPRLASTDTASG